MHRPHPLPTLLLGGLAALASLGGALWPRIYAQETPIWAAQGVGQDWVTALLAVPLLLGAGHLARRGSLGALLVWAGVLIYLVYSYVLYAFFVHFGPLFLVYVAVLSLSFFLLCACVAQTDLTGVARAFSPRTPVRLTGAWLLGVAAVFLALWSGEIVGALARGSAPETAVAAGLPVNPVHVLDLALLLPGMALTGLLLRRRHPLGYFLAAPLLVVIVVLGVAILGMTLVMAERGFPTTLALLIGMVAFTAVGVVMLTRFLGGLRR
jgi:hypothetical protein